MIGKNSAIYLHCKILHKKRQLTGSCLINFLLDLMADFTAKILVCVSFFSDRVKRINR